MGDPTITVPGEGVALYEMIIAPKRSGMYSGSILFQSYKERLGGKV
jgi:hypothetical protein